VSEARTNRTKAKLAAGEAVFGVATRYTDASFVEMLGFQGFDFLFFDAEHSGLEPSACEHMVRAAEIAGATPIVRVPANQPHLILRFMETGAQGCQVPWVNSGAESEAAVEAVKYRPRGRRGLSGSRVNQYSRVPFAEYVAWSNAETLVIVQIESRESVDRIEEIVAVPDVDVVFIGSTDLAHDLGFVGQPNHAEVKPSIDRVVEAVLAAGKALGVVIRSASDVPRWEERGALYMLTTADALIGPACREFLETARG
jgi:4-hydroxy-2-oxoheptanedioate aldolase